MKNHRGFLLLEVLISVGVLTLISLGAFALYDDALQKAKAQETIELTTELIKGARVFFSNGDLTQFNDATLIANQIAPRAMISGNQLVHPYGGRLIAATRSFGGDPNIYMRLVFHHLANSQDCSSVARALNDVAYHTEIYSSGVFLGAAKHLGGTLNKADLGTFCSQITPGQGVVQVTLFR